MAVADRGAVRVVLALRADDVLDLFLKRLGQHAEPEALAAREQALLRGVDELAERCLNSRKERKLLRLPSLTTSKTDTALIGGFLLSRGPISRTPRSQSDRTRREDRFYGLRDNLRTRPMGRRYPQLA